MAIDNKKIAADVLAAVGGKSNVSMVTHCMTRLRFNLKDTSIPKEDEIKKIPGVAGVMVAGGQYQVVIGQNVPKVYAEVCALGGFAAQAAIDEKLDKPKEKLTLKNIGNNVLNYIAGSMTPLIPVLVTAALFKTVGSVLGPDMLGVLSAESDTYILMDFLYDALFYFFPIFLGCTAAMKLNLSPALGMYAGAMILAPDFAALVGSVETFKIYEVFPAPVANYGQTVVPALLSVWVLSVIYTRIKRIMPDMLSTIFTPFLSMIILVPIEFCILAPLGSYVGTLLAAAISMLSDLNPAIAMAVVSALWLFCVVAGMHIAVYMVAMVPILTLGYDTLVLPATSIATVALWGMTLGAFLKLKDKDEKSLAVGYLASAVIGGVAEPALYGLGFKYKRTFITMTIAAAIGGLVGGLTGVCGYPTGGSNFLLFLTFVPGGTTNLVRGLVACAVALIVGAVLTYFFGFSKNDLATHRR